MYGTLEEQLDTLIGTSIAELDIPEHLNELAVNRYEQVGSWLSDRYWNDPGSGCEVYPQGSFRLGTVVRPIDPEADYDIDLVCRRGLHVESVTQADLKRDVGLGMSAYVNNGAEGDPTLKEGKRCWTLVYRADPFHMDVLPAIPSADGAANAILLTDTELRSWQHSNPIDYSAWFYSAMAKEFLEEKARVAKSLRAAEVEEVPDWRVKTTLQRTVQALKRHRDRYFSETPDDRPASIIITTLAARAYTGRGRLYDVLIDVTAKMPSLVDNLDGVWWVPNPVQPRENFADRWRHDPRSAERFFAWMEEAHADFAGFRAERGVDRVLQRVAKSFGEAPAKRAGAVLGSGLSEARQSGRLNMASSTGLLGGAGRTVPSHTFHGDTLEDQRP
jgi:hypothetical protein